MPAAMSVESDIHALVCALVPAARRRHGETSEERLQRKEVTRRLESGVASVYRRNPTSAPSDLSDHIGIVESIRKKLARFPDGAERTKRFNNLCLRLDENQSNPLETARLLELLNELGWSAARSAPSASPRVSGTSHDVPRRSAASKRPRSPPPGSVQRSPSHAFSPGLGPGSSLAPASNNHLSPGRVSPSLAYTARHRVSSLRSAGSAPPAATSAPSSVPLMPVSPAERVRAWREKNGRPVVPETMLLQDVLFVLNGINGTHVQLEEVPSLAPDSVIPHQASMREKVTRVVFMDDGSHVIPMPTQQLIHRIAELGRLYRHISGFVEARLQDAATGLAMQALCSFVDEELRDYYRLVATLESQLKDVEKRAVPAAGEVQKSTTAGVSTQLTLQRLAIWTSDTLLRMRLLSTIIEACKDAKGGALASIIDAYSVNGDPLIQSLIEALLDRVTRPMFKTLAKWIFEGELDDPFQEFFVQVNADYGPNAFAIPTLGVVDEGLATYDAASFWQHRFSMRPEMLPTFISTQFGRKIFATGKSLNFVRYACGSSDWISAQAFHKRDHDLRYSDLDGLERAVDKAHAIVSKHLGDIFLDKLHLVQHLRAMRDYLMLGRGDFVDLLREQLQEYLNQPSSLLQRHNVTMALESAIRRSSAQYDSSDITRRLDAKILEDSAGDVGWDVFTIEYKVDSPVNTVLDGPAMQAYQIIFGHLWRIKRTEVAVSNAWHTLTAARGVLRDLRRRTPLAEALHAVAEVALLRLHEMNHMVGQLQSYVQLECCAYSWEDLMGSLRDEVDLDELINLHRKYVEALIAKILLRTSSRRGHDPDFLASEVRTAMHVIRSYAELCLQLANLAYNWSAAISPGSGEIDPTVQQQMPVEIEKLSTRLAEQSTRFRERLQTISDGLDKHPNLIVRDLSTRLNFNMYYETSRAHRKARDRHAASHAAHAPVAAGKTKV